MSFTSSEGGWEMPGNTRQYPACPKMPTYTKVKDEAFSFKTASPAIGKVVGKVQENTTCVC